jgi:hypothetical protein
MRSHTYELTWRDWIRALGPIALALAALAALAHLVLGYKAAEVQRAPATLDDIIVTAKAKAEHQARAAQILFVGDSSCLMDVSAREWRHISEAPPCWNLGTLSTLGLAKFRQFLEANLPLNEFSSPGQSKQLPTVILLISPEMVRTGGAIPSHELHHRPSRRLRQKETVFNPASCLAEFYTLIGASLVRADLADRLLTLPLASHWGEFYGFLPAAGEYIQTHLGCAVDPSTRDETPAAPPLNARELSVGFRQQCAVFRRGLPHSLKLAVGLTPIPRSEADSHYPDVWQQIAIQMKQALEADVALTNLPPALGDHYFSSSTHLNEAGAREFTHHLHRALREAGILGSAPP